MSAQRPSRLVVRRRRTAHALVVTVATVAIVFTVVTLGAPPRAWAAWDTADEGWDGLSELLGVAQRAQVVLRVDEPFDWRRVEADDVVLLVSPGRPAGPQEAAARDRWLEQGGRLVVFDDFRGGESWTRSLGVAFDARPGDATRYHLDRAHLPIVDVDAAAGPFLGYHTDEVVLNRPAALVAAPTRPRWRVESRGRYADGVRSWAMEALGPRGRALVVADASMLINAMLSRFADNQQFVANTLRYYCLRDRPCVVHLVAGDTPMQGRFEAAAQDDDRRPFAALRDRQAVRDAATSLADRAAAPLAAPLWSILALLGIAVPATLLARAPRPLVPRRTEAARERSVLSTTVAAWLAQPDADYRRPARLLANHLARLLAVSLGEEPNGPDGRAALAGDAMRGAVRRLVQAERLSISAGERLDEIAVALQRVSSGGDDAPVDRGRFTRLAAEVEWAEHVLSHTASQGRAGQSPGVGR